ncbi:MAG TPA: c-type cytochrome biogenesis protein CcmI [Alphaproteobacteria bacterium]|jgi:cytochrome c-type biogenesis protein CcmH|nr:c-type cytochrome biogenesis protein CcmI [Alphaproteobacteria bacterium]
MLWIALAIMTLAAVAAATAPLLMRRRSAEAPRAALDIALFKDQLAELERERANGEIGEAEAVAARREIERRLIAAGRSLEKVGDTAKPVRQFAARARLAAVLACIMIPAALLLYLALGSPGAPAYLTAYSEFRAQEEAQRAELAHLVGLVEEHLADNPNDGQGWAILASAKLKLTRLDEARAALDKARALLPPKDAAEAVAKFAQTFADVSEGQALPPIRQYASEAVELDPDNPRGHMLLAFVAMRSGDRDSARAELTEIVKRAPADSPFAVQAKAMLAHMGGAQPDGAPKGDAANDGGPKTAP